MKCNYIIARKWNDDSDQLCVYTYGSQVYWGTKKDAEIMAKYVRKQTGKKDYKPIYIEV